jgi:hypothetical protein
VASSISGVEAQLAESPQVSVEGPVKPLVGIVAQSDQFDAALREALRARERSYPVLIVSDDPNARRIGEFTATEFVESVPDTSDRATVYGLLAEWAQEHEQHGLVIHENPEEWIDYNRSLTALRDDENSAWITAKTTATAPQGATGAEDGPIIAAIPAYNESETIAEVVTATDRYVDTVLVVDDGSDDETADRARDAGAVVIEHTQNKGYGAAVKTAFRSANRRNARHLVLIDADGQHEPADIPRLLSTQRAQEVELVIGSRYVDGGERFVPLYRRFGLGVINRLTNLCRRIVGQGAHVQDTQSGFRAFDRQAIRSIAEDDTIDDGMAASTDILFHADRNGFTIHEIGTEIRYDGAESSLHPVSHGAALVGHVLKVAEGRRPLMMLGLPGGLLILGGIATAYFAAFGIVSGALAVHASMFAVLLVIGGIIALMTHSVMHGLDVYCSRR